MAGGAAFVVQCYGDSLTAGYTDGGRSFHPYKIALAHALEAQGLRVDVRATGLSGWTARDLVGAADKESIELQGFANYTGPRNGLRYLLASEPASLCIILAGTNDLSCYYAPDAIAASIWSLHTMAHERGVRTVAIAVPEASYHHGNLTAAAERDAINALLRERCEGGLCTYFPFPMGWSEGSAHWDDGLHLSPAGYDALGCALAPTVLSALAAPALPTSGPAP